MDKKMLIDLFERRDKKRRRNLYLLYHELIFSELTASYVAEMICKDLQRDGLVSIEDVKFCRYQFKNKPIKTGTKQSAIKLSTMPDLPKASELDNKPVSGSWSDPDKLDLQKNFIIKSKFSKDK